MTTKTVELTELELQALLSVAASNFGELSEMADVDDDARELFVALDSAIKKLAVGMFPALGIFQ